MDVKPRKIQARATEFSKVSQQSGELPVRIITMDAWHSLFARNLFLRPINFNRTIGVDEPRFTVLHAPHFHARPTI